MRVTVASLTHALPGGCPDELCLDVLDLAAFDPFDLSRLHDATDGGEIADRLRSAGADDIMHRVERLRSAGLVRVRASSGRVDSVATGTRLRGVVEARARAGRRGKAQDRRSEGVLELTRSGGRLWELVRRPDWCSWLRWELLPGAVVRCTGVKDWAVTSGIRRFARLAGELTRELSATAAVLRRWRPAYWMRPTAACSVRVRFGSVGQDRLLTVLAEVRRGICLVRPPATRLYTDPFEGAVRSRRGSLTDLPHDVRIARDGAGSGAP